LAFFDGVHWAIVVLLVATGLVTDPIARAFGRFRYRVAWWLRITGAHASDWLKARMRRR
jgi:hypothetical protein